MQCDKLSRHKRPTDPEVGFSEEEALDVQRLQPLWNLLMALDPTAPIESNDQFELTWDEIGRVTKAIYT